MAKKLAALIPILVGIALGILVTRAPAAMKSAGPLAMVLAVVLVFALLIGFIAWMIGRNLPAHIALTSLPEGSTPPEVRALVDAYRALGFTPAGPPREAGVMPPALLVPLVHEGERCYGTVFRTGTVPAKTSYDVVSILDGDRGGLTTGPDPAGTTLPAAPGNLRQVFPRATVAALFGRHREALAFLRSRGLGVRAVSAASFEADFRASFARQRRAFRAAPLRWALIALWRSATKRTPHLGPLATQKIAERQLRELATGTRA
jgi:hypothetical protein